MAEKDVLLLQLATIGYQKAIRYRIAEKEQRCSDIKTMLERLLDKPVSYAHLLYYLSFTVGKSGDKAVSKGCVKRGVEHLFWLLKD